MYIGLVESAFAEGKPRIINGWKKSMNKEDIIRLYMQMIALYEYRHYEWQTIIYQTNDIIKYLGVM